MDNPDLPLPNASLPGQLPESLWPTGRSGDDRPIQLHYITRYAGPRATAPLEAHAFWELTYVMGGHGTLDLEDCEIPLASAAGVLVPPHCPHRERTDHPKWDTLWLGFRSELPSRLGVVSALAFGDGYALHPWAEQIWLWRQRETGAIGPELEALTAFFIRALVRLARSGSGAMRKPWLARVQDYIDHHLQRDLSIQELAEVSGHSVGHFHRQFRQATGETPGQYLTRRRLETAWLYLRQSGLPIKEIAAAVGFHDPLYFSRVFRKHFGQSPSCALAAG